MFIAREKELAGLKEQFASNDRTAVLVYGKRRVGKSTLIAQASKDFDGIVVSHLCVQSTFQGNLELLSHSISLAFDLPEMHFSQLYDAIDFLTSQEKRVLLVLDEYQYLKNSLKGNQVDSMMQAIIDTLTPQVKIVLCGSFVTLMRELLDEGNPLFGRFTQVVHLEEFDYYDAAKFFPNNSPYDKAAIHAIFGGSPYVLSILDYHATLAENIEKFLLPTTGILRVHVESVMLKEVQRAYDVRILEALGNGKKRYSEIGSALGAGDDKGLLDKQLKSLVSMETIGKTEPINRRGDRRKQFYEIQDNLMRFYFSYIFGNEALLVNLGEVAFFSTRISKSVNQFVSRRFEEIVRQYFRRLVRAGKLEGVTDFGTYWYDDPVKKVNGEYDCVLAREGIYDFYECKYFNHPMTLEECQAEENQVKNAPGINIGRIGFVCTGGFDFAGKTYDLVSGEDLYKPL